MEGRHDGPAVRSRTRALLLQGDNRLFITFFDSHESLEAAEQRFDEMGNEIPESVRSRRVGVATCGVLLDEQRPR